MPLTHDTPMPFGKYRGTSMKDVPSNYLNWLWRNGIRDDCAKGFHSPVGDYIKANMQAMKKKHPKLNWK